VAINAVLPLEVGSRQSRQLFLVLKTRPAPGTKDALKIEILCFVVSGAVEMGCKT